MINLPVIDDDKSQLPIHQNPTYQYGAIGIVVILVLLGFYLWKWSYKNPWYQNYEHFVLNFFGKNSNSSSAYKQFPLSKQLKKLILSVLLHYRPSGS